MTLPVIEAGRVVAVVTDRDIVARMVAADRDPHAVRVEEVATKDLVTARPDQDVDEARRLMAEHHLDRLILVEEDDHPPRDHLGGRYPGRGGPLA